MAKDAIAGSGIVSLFVGVARTLSLSQVIVSCLCHRRSPGDLCVILFVVIGRCMAFCVDQVSIICYPIARRGARAWTVLGLPSCHGSQVESMDTAARVLIDERASTMAVCNYRAEGCWY